MGVFFVGWQLWQDMTFVLGCCVALVFAAGLGKLWWSTRQLRRHEAMDEEKRARVAEMRHCGINFWAANEVPFGVRAIQCGIEVEGIWISRPHSPDAGQLASSATFFNEHPESATAKGKGIETASKYPSQTNKTPERSLFNRQASATPRTIPSLNPSRPENTSSDTHSSHSTYPPSHTTVRAYIPTGLRGKRKRISHSSETHSPCPSISSVESDPIGPTTESTASTRVSGDLTQYGIAQLYVNRGERKRHRDFELLPTGSLGTRQEFTVCDGDDVASGEGNGQPLCKEGYSRPRKMLNTGDDSHIRQNIR